MTNELEFDTPKTDNESVAAERLDFLLFIDTETTGLPDFKKPADDPSQPRVCSFAALVTDNTGTVINGFASLIKPDNWPAIDPKAFETHGLTLEHCDRYGVPAAIVFAVAEKMMGAADRRIGHNISFDLKILRGELRRAGLDDHYDKERDYCTMHKSRDLCQVPPTDKMMAAGRKGFKVPSLEEAYQHFFGKPIVNPHTALADVRACMKIYFAINPVPGT
jgi:DNA polymerase-3 subunit epsilon